MADSVTFLHKFTKPEVGASDNTWGSKLNSDLDGVDHIFRDRGGAVSTDGSGTAYTYSPVHLGSPSVGDEGEIKLVTGLFIRTRIHTDNTNKTPTLKYTPTGSDALDAKPIKKQNLGQFVNLEVGDLQQGYIAEFLYHTTVVADGAWIFLNPPPEDAVSHANQLCFHRNLAVERVSDTHVSIKADSAVLRSKTGGVRAFRVVSQTIDLLQGGAGGRVDVDRTANTWYSIYLIAKADGIVDGMFSDTRGGPGPVGGAAAVPALPSGYTFYGYVGSARTDAAQKLVQFHQSGNMATIFDVDGQSANKTTGDFTEMTLYGCPPEAVAVRVGVSMTSSATGSAPKDLHALIAPDGAGNSAILGRIIIEGDTKLSTEVTVVLKTARKILTRSPVFSTLGVFKIYTHGYWL